ncbi:scaffold attachment factor B2-like isoform X2 [Eulemur rufifrons]|uniref:scaffold attachment factor B2-like isoform X2 n=1 Tax=Eulemur rufifrons TaxID=859984 RepID=UPI003743404D
MGSRWPAAETLAGSGDSGPGSGASETGTRQLGDLPAELNKRNLYTGSNKSVLMERLKVVGAKVVTNARSPGARCYGFVTMSTSDEATKCISDPHRTELHGRMISVEKVRPLVPVVAPDEVYK